MMKKQTQTITLKLTERDSEILEKLSKLSGWDQQHILIATIRNHLSRWLRIYEEQYKKNLGMDPYTDELLGDQTRQ